MDAGGGCARAGINRHRSVSDLVMLAGMILTTTNNIDGYKITEYIRIVAGETITGINAFKDLGAGLRNIVGGRSESYEQEAVQAREQALNEIWNRATELGADAVFGLSFDYSSMGTQGSLMMVSVTGTAVKLAPAQ